MILRYADGTRTYEEISSAMNDDPEFKSLLLQPRRACLIRMSIDTARKRGVGGASVRHERVHKTHLRDSFRLWLEYRGGERQADIAQRLGVSKPRVNQLIRVEELRQVRLGNVSVGGELLRPLEEIIPHTRFP
jgi:hypothetical protein